MSLAILKFTIIIRLLQDGERVMEYWDRYRFTNKGYSLNIQRLECEDQGTYVCKAINGFGVHEISFQLDLLGMKKIYIRILF
jgi:hypothetical protein